MGPLPRKNVSGSSERKESTLPYHSKTEKRNHKTILEDVPPGWWIWIGIDIGSRYIKLAFRVMGYEEAIVIVMFNTFLPDVGPHLSPSGVYYGSNGQLFTGMAVHQKLTKGDITRDEVIFDGKLGLCRLPETEESKNTIVKQLAKSGKTVRDMYSDQTKILIGLAQNCAASTYYKLSKIAHKMPFFVTFCNPSLVDPSANAIFTKAAQASGAIGSGVATEAVCVCC
ncbi:MAG: hypothetical protein ACRYGR_00135 [Janthinobacterium lividum]